MLTLFRLRLADPRFQPTTAPDSRFEPQPTVSQAAADSGAENSDDTGGASPSSGSAKSPH